MRTGNVLSPGKLLYIYFCIYSCLYLWACSGRPKSVYHYETPTYNNIQLKGTGDTIHFPLPVGTYGNIRSSNYFIDNGIEYVSLFDKNSKSINIFSISDNKLLKKISLSEILPHRNLTKQTTVFCKNLDSILVINKVTLYILNRSNSIKDSINFQTKPIIAFPSFSTGNPPFFYEDRIYIKAKPILSVKEPVNIEKWKNFYEIDMKNGTAKLTYNLPDQYENKAWGYFFFEFGNCINERGNVVLSFPADSNIYETNMKEINDAYTGKSLLQTGKINGVSNDEFNEENGMMKSFLVRNSYGDIFFDSYHKRYIRIVEKGITENEYMLGKKNKDKSLIFFDSDLRIIGETKLDKEISISNIFITRDGKIYVRINPKDENIVHFVRLEYIEDSNIKSINSR